MVGWTTGIDLLMVSDEWIKKYAIDGVLVGATLWVRTRDAENDMRRKMRVGTSVQQEIKTRSVGLGKGHCFNFHNDFSYQKIIVLLYCQKTYSLDKTRLVFVTPVGWIWFFMVWLQFLSNHRNRPGLGSLFLQWDRLV